MNTILIITGPSGIGKTYLAEQLIDIYPDHFESVRLFTTRPVRKNEPLTDRIPLTKAEFAKRNKKGDFLVAEQFNGNWYGYSKSALAPSDKIIVVNTWPALVPRFADIPGVCIIGLTTAVDNIDLLKKRMAARGDSEKTITERIQLIKRDINDLQSVKSLINKSGRIFSISNNNTIHKDVIPWIKSALLN